LKTLFAYASASSARLARTIAAQAASGAASTSFCVAVSVVVQMASTAPSGNALIADRPRSRENVADSDAAR
jgi:hypothetical protein